MSDEENLPDLPAESAEKPAIERDESGRFVKGVSGNPNGRGKGVKNRIKEIQLQHELALREYMSDPTRQLKVLHGLDNIFRIMEQGEDKDAVAAAKLVFDRLMPKHSPAGEESGGGPRAVQVIIENNTGTRAGLATPGVTIDMKPAEGSDE